MLYFNKTAHNTSEGKQKEDGNQMLSSHPAGSIRSVEGESFTEAHELLLFLDSAA